MQIKGKIIYMRRNRIGLQCNDGLVYAIEDIDFNSFPYKHGDVVVCEVIDENNCICKILSI